MQHKHQAQDGGVAARDGHLGVHCQGNCNMMAVKKDFCTPTESKRGWIARNHQPICSHLSAASSATYSSDFSAVLALHEYAEPSPCSLIW